MISHTAVNANGFIYCSVYQSPNETTTYHNDNVGEYHAAIYMLEGNLDTYPSETEILASDAVNAPLAQGQLYDISNTRGKFVIAKTGNAGASMVMFNPVPADKNLNIKIVDTPQNVEIDSSAGKVTIVCLTGPVTVNGKTVNSMEFVRVYQGVPATLIVNEDSICALVS